MQCFLMQSKNLISKQRFKVGAKKSKKVTVIYDSLWNVIQKGTNFHIHISLCINIYL